MAMMACSLDQRKIQLISQVQEKDAIGNKVQFHRGIIGVKTFGEIAINNLAGIVTPFDIPKERHFFFQLPTRERILEKKPRYTYFIKNVIVSLDNKTTTITFKSALDLNNYVSRRDLQLEGNQVGFVQLPVGLLKSGRREGYHNFAESLKKRKMQIDGKLVDFVGYSFWSTCSTSCILRSISWEPKENVRKSRIIRRLEEKITGCDIKLPNLFHCFDIRDFITFESALLKSNELAELKRQEALLDLDPQMLIVSILNESTPVPQEKLEELEFILDVYYFANCLNPPSILPQAPTQEIQDKQRNLNFLIEDPLISMCSEDVASLEEIFDLASF